MNPATSPPLADQLAEVRAELKRKEDELQEFKRHYSEFLDRCETRIHQLGVRSEELEGLLSSSREALILVDADLRIRQMTAPAAAIFRLDDADKGESIEYLARRVEGIDLIDSLGQATRTGAETQAEIIVGECHYTMKVMPLAGKTMQAGTVLSLVDVNCLKQAEEKVNWLSAIVESSGDAIISRNTEGVITSWNRAASMMFGYTAEEALGRSISFLLPPGKQDEAIEATEAILSETWKSKTIETSRRHRDGREIEISLRVSPIRDAGGNIIGFSGISRDISRRKKAEREREKLAAVAQNTDNGVVITNTKGRIEWVNEGFTRITGFTPDEAKGRRPGELLQGPDTDPEAIETMGKAIRAQEPFQLEVLNYTKGGEKYWNSIQCQPIRDADGELTSFVAVQSDVTRIKNAEVEAREAVARRDRFLAMLSHELRNPLGAIVNAIRAVRAGAVDLESAHQVIDRQAGQMSRLLDDLLDVARFTREKIILRRKPFDAASLLDDAQSSVEHIYKEQRVSLAVERPDEPVPILGDPSRILQLQVNLLTNAAKYTPAGGRVWYSMVSDGYKARITVRDTGLGIEEEMLARVFDPFVQAEQASSTPHGGLGVGLTLTKQLVEAHGGSISASSLGKNQGTTFEVILPLSDETIVEETAPPVRMLAEGTILLVDDVDDSRRMLKLLLEMDGFRVVEASTGQRAVEVFESESPEIAIIDIGLPDIDGHEVARQIRERCTVKPKLIALTGYVQAVDEKKSIDAGFEAHLAKPVDLLALRGVLTRQE